MKPHRIQLSHKKGWRMPENTVKVDRSTKWGNPFIVGKHSNAKSCVDKFKLLCDGYRCISVDRECYIAQREFCDHAKNNLKKLRGKNLACWCKPGTPCHADVLLEIANA